MSKRTKTQVKFRVPEATHQALQVIALVQGVSLSEVVRRAAERFVEDAKGRKP